MCPFCIGTAAILAASASGTGGVAALLTGKLWRRSTRKAFTEASETKEVEHGHNDNDPKAVAGGIAQRMD